MTTCPSSASTPLREALAEARFEHLANTGYASTLRDDSCAASSTPPLARACITYSGSRINAAHYLALISAQVACMIALRPGWSRLFVTRIRLR